MSASTIILLCIAAAFFYFLGRSHGYDAARRAALAVIDEMAKDASGLISQAFEEGTKANPFIAIQREMAKKGRQ